MSLSKQLKPVPSVYFLVVIMQPRVLCPGKYVSLRLFYISFKCNYNSHILLGQHHKKISIVPQFNALKLNFPLFSIPVRR